MNVVERIWTIRTQNLSQKRNIDFTNKKNDIICASIVFGKNVNQWKFLDHKMWKKPSLIYQLNIDDYLYRENFILTKIKNFGDHIEVVDRVKFSKYDLINAFEEYGGSFVKSLWHCLSCADPINTKKIMETFQNYVNEYVFEFIKSDK